MARVKCSHCGGLATLNYQRTGVTMPVCEGCFRRLLDEAHTRAPKKILQGRTRRGDEVTVTRNDYGDYTGKHGEREVSFASCDQARHWFNLIADAYREEL